jgi:hypothetical protein
MKRSSLVSALFTAMLLVVAGASHAIVFKAHLDGPSENPPNDSPGTGFALVDFDTVLHEMRVQAEFSGLVAPTVAAHIHCCVDPPGNVGVATPVPTFPGFPLGVTSGTFDMAFDLTDLDSFNPAFVAANGGSAAGAEAALFAGLSAGQAYFNIHTDPQQGGFGGGEIRGFLVPEPGIIGLLALALGAAFAATRRRRS